MIWLLCHCATRYLDAWFCPSVSLGLHYYSGNVLLRVILRLVVRCGMFQDWFQSNMPSSHFNCGFYCMLRALEIEFN